MKLVKAPSKIIGLRVGEVMIDQITGNGIPRTKYLLLRDPEGDFDGINAGQYTKEKDYSEKTMEALKEFISCLEEDALPELFEVTRKNLPEELRTEDDEKGEEDRLDFPGFPTLGTDSKSTPQV